MDRADIVATLRDPFFPATIRDVEAKNVPAPPNSMRLVIIKDAEAENIAVDNLTVFPANEALTVDEKLA